MNNKEDSKNIIYLLSSGYGMDCKIECALPTLKEAEQVLKMHWCKYNHYIDEQDIRDVKKEQFEDCNVIVNYDLTSYSVVSVDDHPWSWECKRCPTIENSRFRFVVNTKSPEWQLAVAGIHKGMDGIYEVNRKAFANLAKQEYAKYRARLKGERSA